jgi:UDP-N-acetylglucosamine 2-epimerase (non-hydrolysing)
MIYFWVGTTAEYIKIYMIYRELINRNLECKLIITNQHVELPSTIKDGDLSNTIFLYRPSKSLMSIAQAAFWFVNNFVLGAKLLFELKYSGNARIISVVQGDTLTTLLGSFLTRIFRYPLAHVEAGLRSGHIFNPFPEEIIRRIVTSLAILNYVPDERYLKNIPKRKHKLVTHGNTGNSKITMAFESSSQPILSVTKSILIVLHRTEFLVNYDQFEKVMKFIVSKFQASFKITIVVDSHSAFNFDKFKLRNAELVSSSNITFVPKLNHDDFLVLLFKNSCVITDSGGIQEECAIIGKPCGILRNSTERIDGLNENAILLGFDFVRISNFIENHIRYVQNVKASDFKPVQIVVADLIYQLQNYE